MSRVLAHWRTLRRTVILIVVFVGWLWGGVAATIAVASASLTDAAAPHCAVVAVLVGSVGVATAIGCLVLFWVIAKEIRFVRHGYRIHPMGRWVLPVSTLCSGEWVYEERARDGRIQSLPFTRIVLANRYPAHSELRFPVDDDWDTQSPVWARGRRAQIIDRVIASMGGPSFTRMERIPEMRK